MSQLVAKKTYDKFTETTEIRVGDYELLFKYHSSPGSEYLCVTRGYPSFSQDIVLIDDKYRFKVNQSLSREDLLCFCHAQSIDASHNGILTNLTDRQRKLYIQSLIPAAKLMYNTLYSQDCYSAEEIQREWANTGSKARHSEEIGNFVDNNKSCLMALIILGIIFIGMFLLVRWLSSH